MLAAIDIPHFMFLALEVNSIQLPPVYLLNHCQPLPASFQNVPPTWFVNSVTSYNMANTGELFLCDFFH